MHARVPQRGSLLRVARLKLRASLQQLAEDVHPSRAGGHHEGRVPVGVGDVRVGAGHEELRYYGRQRSDRGEEQRGRAVWEALVDVCAAGEEKVDGLVIRSEHRVVQGRGTVGARGVDGAAEVEPRGDDV